LRRTKAVVEEELIPKATGREKMIENKKLKAAYTKSRKDDEIDEEIKDDQLYGENSDFKRALHRQKSFQAQKQQAKLEESTKRLEDYRAKEASKLAPFVALLKTPQNIPLLNVQQPNNH